LCFILLLIKSPKMSTNKHVTTSTTTLDYHSCLNVHVGLHKPGLDGNGYAPLVASSNAVDVHVFVTTLAHEVRNPLASINLSAEMLGMALRNNELKMYVDIIVRNSERINDLIVRFLKSQYTNEVKVEIYSVGEMIDEVLSIVGDRLRLKNITVVKQLGVKNVTIMVNRPKMKIALTNIIINAIDAMPTADGVLKILLRTVKGQRELLIEDNGCGISKQNLQRIFKAGFTNKPGGLGFGLQITNDILRANNVGIKVSSRLGKWTRFILLFNENASDHPVDGKSTTRVKRSELQIQP